MRKIRENGWNRRGNVVVVKKGIFFIGVEVRIYLKWMERLWFLCRCSCMYSFMIGSCGFLNNHFFFLFCK